MAFDIVNLFNLLGFIGVPPNEEGIDGDLAVNNSTGQIFQKRNSVWVDTHVMVDTMLPEMGPEGPDGKSAYKIAVDNGYSGTPQEWLISLIGSTGNTGRGISVITIDSSRHLIVTYDDDSTEDVGLITVGLSNVATSGSYNDLSNKPSIPDSQVQASWTQSDSGNIEFIKNKPVLGSAALAQLSDFATSAQGSKADSALQTPLSYTILTDKPTLGTAAAQDSTSFATASQGAKADTAVQPPVTWASVTGKPTLSTVATSGSYTDLSNKPSIPSAQVNSDWTASSGVSQILNKPNLSAVATSGSYSDLSGTPSIPIAQVQSSWVQTATGAVDYIKSKPSLSAVATSGSYADLTGKPVLASGSGALAAILLAGVSIDVVITLSNTFPNTGYTAIPCIAGVSSSVLGSLSIAVKSKTTTTVTVTAKNTGLVSIAAGPVIEVIALG